MPITPQTLLESAAAEIGAVVTGLVNWWTGSATATVYNGNANIPTLANLAAQAVNQVQNGAAAAIQNALNASTAAQAANTSAQTAMNTALLASKSAGLTKIYATKAQATADLPNLVNNDWIEVCADESITGSPRTRYQVQSGALVLEVNLDQLREDLANTASGKGAALVATDDTYANVQAHLNALASALQPSLTAGATFAAATNTLTMTGIVAALGLQIGDVIQVTGSTSNNRTLTVESITDANDVICNAAHASGAGPLSFVNETDASGVSVQRIAKYYNAPVGLGQQYVNVLPNRNLGVSYINTTNRTIQVSITLNTDMSTTVEGHLIVNNVVVSELMNAGNSSIFGTAKSGDALVSPSLPYGFFPTVGAPTPNYWVELR